MRSGSLRHKITIQYPTKVTDDMGGSTVTWNDWDTVWAAIWPLRGAERLQAQQLEMSITNRIRMRYRRGLKPSWRIVFGNKTYNIQSIINPNERNIYLDLMCEEVV